MPTTAERRQKIAAATAAAREQGIARREAHAQMVEASYTKAGEAIADWLKEHAGPDGDVGPEHLSAFDAFLDMLLRELQDEWEKALAEGLAELAAFGAQWIDIGSGTIAGQALDQVRSFVGADGLQLSDRVWRVNAHTRRTIVETLRGAIHRGATAREAARALLGEGKGVSAEIAELVRAARAGALGDTITDALLAGTGNPMRNALRVVRTEMNRAFTESFVGAAFDHDDVAGVKFTLSPMHPRPDICDVYAKANLHGMGPGVYPRGAHPYPAHPETLSYLVVVFVDEITAEDRAGRQSMSDWLRLQPHGTQEQVLGVAKANAFRAGDLADADLLRPWRDLDPNRNLRA